MSVPRWVREWTGQYLGGAGEGVKRSQAGVGAIQLWELIWGHLES